MKEAFPNTAKSCKWRSSTNSRSHFQFDVTLDGKAYQLDYFCSNGSHDSLKGSDFQTDDGTHRSLNMDLIRGFIVVGKLDDVKEHKYKEIREEVKKRIPTYRNEKGLGPKDNNFLVGIENHVENFDEAKVVKKIKDHKEWDSTKTVCGATSAEMMQNLIKVL